MNGPDLTTPATELPLTLPPPKLGLLDALVLSLAAILTAGILIAVVVFFGIVNVARLSSVTTATIIAIQSIGIVFGVYLAARFARRISWMDLGLTPVAPMVLVKAAILGVLVYFGVVFSVAFIDPDVHHAVRDIFASGQITVPGIVASIVAAAFFAPIAEELLFRGVMFQGMFHKWGYWPAALISSIIFGALHFHPDHMVWPVATAVLGLILCKMTQYYGSIIPAIVFHAVYNGIGMSVTFLTID